MSDAVNLDRVYTSGLRLLSRREHSVAELRRKLAQRGASAAEADTVLQRLIDEGSQSDERYAASRIRHRITTGHGPRWILAEFRHDTVDPEVVDRAFASEAPDWIEIARGQLQRRFGDEPATVSAERAKRMAFLLRRGFDPEHAAAALARL